MNKLISTILPCSLLILSFCTQAEWIEASGRAPIINGDKQAARLEAVEDAIQQALLFSGASYSSTQTLAQGLLVDEQVQLTQGGEVQGIRLLREQSSYDWVNVTVSVDIFADQRQCRAPAAKKPLVIAQSIVKHPEQTIVGQIGDIGDKFSQSLVKSFTQRGKHAEVREYFGHTVNFDPEHIILGRSHLKDTVRGIATNADSQYVLLSIIHDTSMSEKQPPNWKLWADNPQRHFIAEVFLFDGLSAELMFRQSYRSQATWPKNQRETFDLNSQVFWQSPYGQAVTKHIGAITADVNAAMACEPLTGRIVGVGDDEVTFNLGRVNGVKEGTRVALNYFTAPTDSLNIPRTRSADSGLVLEVVEVQQRTATARTIEPSLLRNIQIHDTVTVTHSTGRQQGD